MKTVFLSIGSNVEPEKNVPACLKLLKERFHVLKISTIYETDPVGPAGDKKFWNLAVAIETERQDEALRQELRKIEEALGRVRPSKNKFAPRTMDLDILPQADYQHQAFIMIPLAEIAPEEKDTETNLTFQELARPLEASAQSFRKVSESEFAQR